MDDTSVGQKRPKPAAKTTERRQPWMPKGAKVVVNAGRGDCLFRAVADALKVLDPNQRASARSLRASTCAFYKKNTWKNTVCSGMASKLGAAPGKSVWIGMGLFLTMLTICSLLEFGLVTWSVLRCPLL